MTRRMIDSAIWHNEKFGTLPPMARLLAIGIINHADDQGRGKANPVYLRSQIFPYDDVTAGDVRQWLDMVAGNETITVYQSGGKDYYQILNWWMYQSHQYAMPSQYPKPDGWNDRIRKTLTKGVIVTCNWVTNDGKPSPDTCDEQGRPIHLNDQVNDQVNIQDEVKDKGESKDKGKGKDERGAPAPGTSPTYPSGFTDFERNFVVNLINAIQEREPGQRFQSGLGLSDTSRAALLQVMNGGPLLSAKAIDWALDQWEQAKPNERFDATKTGCVNWMLATINNSYKPGSNGNGNHNGFRPKAKTTSAELDAIFGVDIHGNPV